MKCPLCNSHEIDKVIYLALPMRLCRACLCLFGFWSDVAAWLPLPANTDDGPAFKFLVYRGSYVAALWQWLVHP